jgi:hypothetical protein
MSKPTLKHFASLWTLMDYPNGSASGEWSMEKKVAAIKEAGFHGFQSGALPELRIWLKNTTSPFSEVAKPMQRIIPKRCGISLP